MMALRGRGLVAVVVVLVLAWCAFEGVQGSQPSPLPLPRPPSKATQTGVFFPYICSKEITLSKIKVTQSERMYIQYVEYVAAIPHLTSFTLHYWFNLADTTNTSTMLNYEYEPSFPKNLLTVQLANEKGKQGQQQYWVMRLNGVLVSREAMHPPIRRGEWRHALHSWDAHTGVITHYIDGHLYKARTVYESKEWLIPAGGVAVSGQHHSAVTQGAGMDQGEGLNGWLTLLQLSSKPIGASPEDAALAKLAAQCPRKLRGT
ncbi:Sushi, von Willebrand factor type A, EGF and pentraxin domain-containing protein 1 [Chionoecetes opilio]|uniref:Sushi, von Willebrand factor type A, EGF and pentraxin domain-containing protein 1 n=1 Tax=Chionoecetes opilio TaxID=41210 RepID=A0A8J4Y9F4_CHIOP|nr:Sushi, von Willebrand factor type A, EGF and pentraxin domain-containing protein 1 [Chionoecetes opilio]